MCQQQSKQANKQKTKPKQANTLPLILLFYHIIKVLSCMGIFYFRNVRFQIASLALS